MNNSHKKLSPEKYAKLKAEAKAPYRPLRKFVYFSFGASGFIGGVIFLAQLAAGKNVASTLPNLALQISVVVLMILLFRWELKSEKKDEEIAELKQKRRQKGQIK